MICRRNAAWRVKTKKKTKECFLFFRGKSAGDIRTIMGIKAMGMMCQFLAVLILICLRGRFLFFLFFLSHARNW